jgi:beta-N-acetylglucosaminidase
MGTVLIHLRFFPGNEFLCMSASIYPFLHLCQLPQRSVDVIAIKQQLLSQYDMLQSRIKELKEAAEKYHVRK